MIKRYSIDILKPKWPKWKKRIANFFLTNIPILHIGKVNRIIAKHEHLKDGDFIQAVIKDMGIPYELHNADAIPVSGGVTIAANHPGGADVVANLASFWDYRKDFQILANELICVEPVIDMVIPVNVMKKRDKVNEDDIRKAYTEGKAVIFYAAGKNSRYDENGDLKDRRWRTSFLDYAYEYKTPIMVLKILSENTPLFYKVSNFRENSPRMKNIPLENMFQLREIFKQKGRKVDLIVSDLIDFETWSVSYVKGDMKANRMLADKLYNFVYAIDQDNTKIQWEN